MSIVAAVSVSDFFAEAVSDAMKTRRVSVSDGARSYVVALLAELARPGSAVERTLERPLTLLLDEALHTPELGTRFERLRTLGDGVLYASGFFGDHFEARGVDTGYVIGIGKTAYENAGALIMSGSSTDLAEAAESVDIFGELSAAFGSLVDVIAEIANVAVASGVATSRGIVKLYERWLKTRSDTLAEALSSHGFVRPGGRHGGGQVLS